MTRKQVRLLKALNFSIDTAALDKQGYKTFSYEIRAIIMNVMRNYKFDPEYVFKQQQGYEFDGSDALMNALGFVGLFTFGFGAFSLGGSSFKTTLQQRTVDELVETIDDICSDLYRFFKMPAKDTEIGNIQKKYASKFFKWFEKYNSSKFDDLQTLIKEWNKITPTLSDFSQEIIEIMFGDSRIYYYMEKQIGERIKQSMAQKKLDKRLEKGKDKGFWTDRLRKKITKYDNRVAKYDDKINKLREKLNQAF